MKMPCGCTESELCIGHRFSGRSATISPGDALNKARRALMSLYLEVPKDIADDVVGKVEAAFDALSTPIEITKR